MRRRVLALGVAEPHRRLAAVLAVAAAGALIAAPVAAQGPAPEQTARAAQRNFESLRRESLPWTGGGGGGGGRCDARIGRYCYWHGTAPDTAPPEPPAVLRARARLLGALDSAAQLAPGNDWIAGQRVRYWIEAGHPDSAAATVSPCAATAWWCDALRGLALHEAGNDAGALQAFDAALAEMPHPQQCRWTDLQVLLDDPLAARYSRVGCDDRAPLNARLWWLAQPFYALGPNDLRAEHFSRLTMAAIAKQSVWPETASWGDDLQELFVRYGWPRWFERERPDMLSDGGYAIMGHDPQPSFAWFPNGRLLDSAYTARADDWDLDAPHARSRYAPPTARAIEPVRALLSRFRRGDSQVVVAAYDVRGDSVLGRAARRAALAVAVDERQIFVAGPDSAGTTGSLTVTVPAKPALASVELFGGDGVAAGRMRRGLAPLTLPGDGIAVSDILLFRPEGPLPTTLDQAATKAVADVDASGDGRLGLYWEVYGTLNAGTALHVSLTIDRTGVGWWERARRALHLGGSDAPIALRWEDAARPGATALSRSVAVDLSRLDGGSYTVRLQVEVAGRSAVGVERRLEIRR